MIKHADKVKSYFGYWPLFCDAKITDFLLTESSDLRITIQYIDADQKIGARIEILFSQVSQMELSEMRTENVIDELRVPEIFPGKVLLDACFGLHGNFVCTAMEVLSVTSNPSFQRSTFGVR